MANAWTKIYGTAAEKVSNLWRQTVRREDLTYDKYLPYFYPQADNFPLIWHQAISESPSAQSCVSTIADFLEGFDFTDEELGKKVINGKGETFFQIHQKTCRDLSEFEGFYLLVRYNALGKITEIEHLAFENCRLGRPDSNGYISKILYNPYFGTKDFKIAKDTIYYDTFNPKVVKDQMVDQTNAYRGQVLFVGTTTALSRFYPMPEAYSAYKWMKIETGVSDYHEDNINNGFLQPFMLAMLGNPNDPVGEKDADGNQQTQAEAFDYMISTNFMGSKRVGNMMVAWFQNRDEVPIPIAFPSNNTGDLFLNTDTQATKKITIGFKVPAILANINEGVSLGGDGNTVRVAVKLMQQRVIKKQRILTDTYGLILPLMEDAYTETVQIKPYNPYPELEVIDQKIWDALTREEKREWIRANTEIVLFDDDLTDPATPSVPGNIQNKLPVPFPEVIRKAIDKALKYQDKMGLKCGGLGGRELASRIVKNENVGLKELNRIYSYLKKRPELENREYTEGCDVLQYEAWGGKAMEKFLEGELNRLNGWLN